MIVFGAMKGGSGATVVTGLTAVAAARAGVSTTVAGCDDDLATAFGVTELVGRAGLHDILTTPDVAPDAVDRLSVLLRPRLWLLPSGQSRESPVVSIPRSADDAFLLVDASGVDIDRWNLLSESADASLLVMRPCLLALRRACDQSRSASGVIVVDEPGRALDARDVEDVTGLPVVAEVRHDRSIGRTVDAGALAHIGKRAGRITAPVLDHLLHVLPQRNGLK